MTITSATNDKVQGMPDQNGSSENYGRTEYVFSRTPEGLTFIGDFEGLYLAEDDPWAQSVGDDRMGEYYKMARARLVALVARPNGGSIAEVGCGLGQVCAMIAEAASGRKVIGLDISETAVARARERYHDLEFHVCDIRRGWPDAAGDQHAVVLMNQMLWYVLDDLDEVLRTLWARVEPGGRLVIANAFFQGNQAYGRDIVCGFEGLVEFVMARRPEEMILSLASLNVDDDLPFDDGILVLQRSMRL